MSLPRAMADVALACVASAVSSASLPQTDAKRVLDTMAEFVVTRPM